MNNTKKFLFLTAFYLLFLLIPSRASAQSSFIDFSQHIPIFSAGLSLREFNSDSSVVYQFLGYGITFFEFDGVKTGGIEVNLISNVHDLENVAPNGTKIVDRESYLGIGLIMPMTVDLVKFDEDQGIVLRVGVGYGLFGYRKPSKIVLIGIGVRF